MLVGEGERRPGLAQVPGQVAGEHADQHVGFDPVFEPVPDGPQVQVVFADLEVLLHAREVLAGGHRGRGAEGLRGNRGADDVDPVEGRLSLDAGLVTPPGEGPLADVHGEVLGDLPLVDHLPGADTDLGGVGQPPGGDHAFDLGEFGLGGGQQPASPGGALFGEERVVAGDQPFPRVVR